MLDLAVVGLALLVSGTLMLLAWTLGVSAVSAVRKARHRIILTRLQLAMAERQLLERFGARPQGDE
jgi:hypothetical protein